MASELGSNYLSTPCVVYCASIRCCSLGSSFDPDGTGQTGMLICKQGHCAMFVIDCSSCCCWYWHCNNLISTGLAGNGWWFPDRKELENVYEAFATGLFIPTCAYTNTGLHWGEECSTSTGFRICLYNRGDTTANTKSLTCSPAIYRKIVYY